MRNRHRQKTFLIPFLRHKINKNKLNLFIMFLRVPKLNESKIYSFFFSIIHIFGTAPFIQGSVFPLLPLLSRNLALGTFGELLTVFSTKVNLL